MTHINRDRGVEQVNNTLKKTKKTNVHDEDKNRLKQSGDNRV